MCIVGGNPARRSADRTYPLPLSRNVTQWARTTMMNAGRSTRLGPNPDALRASAPLRKAVGRQPLHGLVESATSAQTTPSTDRTSSTASFSIGATGGSSRVGSHDGVVCPCRRLTPIPRRAGRRPPNRHGIWIVGHAAAWPSGLGRV